VQASKVQANLKPETLRSHELRIERNCPWSQPSCAAMPFHQGTAYALGIGRVPV